tara:strand:+ start:285 stop:443 length:159 start_codon:yes stop_codon:yes gene_type:complete
MNGQWEWKINKGRKGRNYQVLLIVGYILAGEKKEIPEKNKIKKRFTTECLDH